MTTLPKNLDVRQEEDRLPSLTILLVAVLMALLLALFVVWAWYALKDRERALRPSLAFPEREIGPRRAVSGELEDIFGERGRGEILNDRKRKEIASFQWVDRQHRIVAIPIDDAVTLLLSTNPQ